MKNGKQNQGITLIALVITIIVLLILAGVTIVTLTGDNGILYKAQSAKTETDNSQEYEQVKLAVLNSKMSNGGTDFSINRNTLDSQLTNLETDVEKTKKDEDTEAFPWRVTGKTGKHYVIDEKGNVYQKNIPASDYGAIVTGYNCTNSAGVNSWKIFYDDGRNVYLIADNYISSEYCPSKNDEDIAIEDNNYKLSMKNVISQYNGSSNITDVRLKKLNKKYFEFLGEIESSTYPNMEAVAYMMDTDIWKDYAGAKAEYAIGGPTIEMLFDSYNLKYGLGSKYQTEVEKKEGYKISADSGKNWFINNESDYLKKDDGLYVIENTERANFMWIASPSSDRPSPHAGQAGCMESVSYNGKLDSTAYIWNGGGFRPLVCLKSDVQLEKQEDGNYLIK